MSEDQPTWELQFAVVESPKLAANAQRERIDATSASDDAAQRLLNRLPELPLPQPEGNPPVVALVDQEARLPSPDVEACAAQTIGDQVARPDELIGSSNASPITYYNPEGNIASGRQISVTFDRLVGQLGAAVPAEAVSIEPAVQGQWRWLEAHCLVFECDGDAFPRSTEFTVTIDPGELGISEATPKSWTFRTPVLKVERQSPGKGLSLSPVHFIVFNQPIDGAAVREALRFQSDDGKPIDFREATPEEISQDPRAHSVQQAIEESEAIAWVPTEPLVLATTYRISLPYGAYALEGPRMIAKPVGFEFTTYEPIRLVDYFPKSSKNERYSIHEIQQSIRLKFNNEIDEERSSIDKITLQPEAERMEIDVIEEEVHFYGRRNAFVNYKTTVPAGALVDSYGQTNDNAIEREFLIEEESRELFAPWKQRDFVTITPDLVDRLVVYVSGDQDLTIHVRSVSAEQFPNFRKIARKVGKKPSKEMVGEIVTRQEHSFDKRTSRHPVSIPIAAALSGGLGNVIVELISPKMGEYRCYEAIWIQVTRIGLTITGDNQQILCRVTTLTDESTPECSEILKPRSVPGAELQFDRGPDEVATTDADGLATLPIAPRRDLDPRLIFANYAGDRCFLPIGLYQEVAARPESKLTQVLWWVVCDRELYRPGETVQVKGLVRTRQHLASSKLQRIEKRRAKWTLIFRYNDEVCSGTLVIDPAGGFDFTVDLPLDCKLGAYSLTIRINGVDAIDNRSAALTIRVQEFVRPEFSVKLSVPESLLYGEDLPASAQVKYFGGGPLADADCRWRMTLCDGSYQPPGVEGYHFGGDRWRTWFYRKSRDEDGPVAEMTTVTDALGQSQVQGLIRSESHPTQPQELTIRCDVRDVDRRWQEREQTIWMHPASVYVGMKLTRWCVASGSPCEFSIIVVDLHGNCCSASNVVIRLTHIEYRYQGGKNVWQRSVEQEQNLGQVTGVVNAASEPKNSGCYELEAIVTDAAGRQHKTVESLWVLGGKFALPRLMQDQQDFALVADRQIYQPGDTANVSLFTSFAEADGLAIVRAGGIISWQVIECEDGQAEFSIPIDRDAMPEVCVQVDLIGRMEDEAACNRIAKSSVKLPIDISSHRLPVSVTAKPDPVKPGGKVTISISVSHLTCDHAGRFTLMIVDEAILDLADYDWPDMAKAFFGQRVEQLASSDTRSQLVSETTMSENEQYFIGGAACRMAAGAWGGEDSDSFEVPLDLRKDFSALASFVANGEVDQDGCATVECSLPDTVTRYRVMVGVWSGDDRFGMGNAMFDTAMPLILRPALPRTLSQGDQAQLTVVVENQSPELVNALVVARATGIQLDDSGKQVTIPGQGRGEVLFKAKATTLGTAHLQFAVASQAGVDHDATQCQIPIRRSVTSSTVATYGELAAREDNALVRCAIALADPDASDRHVEIGVSASAVAKLSDLFLVIKDYDFDCSEQLASRVLAYCTVSDSLRDFGVADAPNNRQIWTQLERDLTRLVDRQNDDGGLPFWRNGDKSSPIVSLRAGHALVSMHRFEDPASSDPADGKTWKRAREKAALLSERLLRYLKKIESKCSRYSREAKQFACAYSFYLQSQMSGAGIPDEQALESKVIQWIEKAPQIDSINPDALALLLPAIRNRPDVVDDLLRRLLARVEQTAALASITRGASDARGVLLHTQEVENAALLIGLMSQRPDHPLVTKLARRLLEAKTGRRYSATYESGWVLDAINQFVTLRESKDPNFVARAWLKCHPQSGDEPSAEQWLGRSIRERAGSAEVRVPIPCDDASLTVAAQGVGTAYWSAKLEYCTPSLSTPALDHGMRLQRALLRPDTGELLEPSADGSLELAAGELVECRLRLVVHGSRFHIALVSPMPAGCEALPPARPQRDVPGTGRSFWSWGLWYDHMQSRDDRVEAFAETLPPGVYELKHLMQVTTLGQFLWPAAWCEEMYRPETFGRTDAIRVRVE